jgi:hypothetical protein
MHNVVVDNWAFPLDCLVNNLWLLDFNSLHLVVMGGVARHDVNFRHSHGFLLNRDVWNFDCPLDYLGFRNFHDHLNWIMNNTFLLLNDWDVDTFLLLVGYMNVNSLFNVEMMSSFLCRDVWDVNDSLLDHWHVNLNGLLHRHVHDDVFLHGDVHILHDLDVPMHNTFLLLDDWHMNNFLLLMRHMDIDMLLHMEMMRALLLLDRGYVHNLFNHHGNWHLYILLHVAMLDSLLRNDLGNMHYLMHIPGNNLWNLVYFLYDLSCWNFDDVLVNLPWVVRVIFLMNILRWGINLVGSAC